MISHSTYPDLHKAHPPDTIIMQHKKMLTPQKLIFIFFKRVTGLLCMRNIIYKS